MATVCITNHIMVLYMSRVYLVALADLLRCSAVIQHSNLEVIIYAR